MVDIPITVNDAVITVVATANGQTDFDFDFLIFDKDHVKAIFTELATGIQTDLTNVADFTIDGIEDPNGETLTLLAISTLIGDTVTIYRDVPVERLADYQQSGDFFADTINRELDLQTQMMQELRRDIDTAVKFPVGDAGDTTLPDADTRANAFMGFDALGDAAVFAGVTGVPATDYMTTLLGSTSLSAANIALGDYVTVTLLKADTVLSYIPGIGKIVVAPGDIIRAQGFRYEVQTSGAAGNISNSAGTPVQFDVLTNADGSFSGEAFGATGGANDTLAIQALYDRLDTEGGGIAQFGAGTFIISNVTSKHANSCIVVPEKVITRGAGKYITTFTRPAAERSIDGILFVNKDYDAVTDYGAAGDITFEDLGITDGAITPTRGLGDLIGFGNGDGLLVQRCYFGNHDQHAVDICKSKNVKILNNVSANAVGSSQSATYQIDAGLIWGIFGASKSSIQVEVAHNEIQKSSANNVIHFHSGNHAVDVSVHDNLINASFVPAGGSGIGGDADCSYENVRIYNNDITVNRLTSRGMNFPSDDTVPNISDFRIYNNTIRGIFRTGIFVGDDSPSLAHTDGPLQSVFVHDNDIYSDISSGDIGLTFRGISVAAFKYAEVKDNKVHLITGTASQTGTLTLINDESCETFVASGNSCTSDAATPTATFYGIRSTFLLHYTNNLDTVKEIKDNFLDLFGCDFHIYCEDVGSMNTYDKLGGVISRNRMIQNPSSAHIKEVSPLSDGTNNLGFIDFGAASIGTDEFVLAVASGQTHTGLVLTGKKQGKDANQRVGAFTMKILYSPTTLSMGTDWEDLLNVYMSATTCAGMQFANINHATGVADLITGVSGVSMVINNTTHQPVIRTSGWIKILCGI